MPTSAVQADACAYGPAWQGKLFETLDALSLASDFRSGAVLKKGFPSFHMCSSKLVSVGEVQNALRTAGPRVAYQLTTTGHQVVSEL